MWQIFRKSIYLLALFAVFPLGGCVPIAPIREGDGSKTPPIMNELVRDIDVAGKSGLFTTPLDATPDATGEMIYFTAMNEQGNGLFSVPAVGGEVTPLVTGSPFVSAQGLDISSDNQLLFVADVGADQIFVVDLTDGAIMPLAGSEGTKPRGVEIVQENSSDVVYFSGVDPVDGQPAVMKISESSGKTTVIVKGTPLLDPVGIAVASNGTLYVADRGADGWGSIFRIEDGSVSVVSSHVRTGQFPGAALNLDESALLVSALDSTRESAQVLVTVLASGEQVIVNKVIEANQGAGGLHRAQNVNTFAWADSQHGGSVYRVRLP